MQKSAQLGICVLIFVIGIALGCRGGEVHRVLKAPFSQSKIAEASQIETAESLYRDGLKLDCNQDAGCIAQYFCAARAVWPVMESDAIGSDCPNGAAAEIYNRCLRKMIDRGQQYGCFEPRAGRLLLGPSSEDCVPIFYRGFPWDPQDFDVVMVASTEVSKKLNHDYRCSGMGVPVVVINKRLEGERFLRDEQAFAATLILRRNRPDEESPCGFVFEFIDPLRADSIRVGGRDIAIARDISAPIAYRISQRDKNYLEGFLQPGTTDEGPGLYLVEPYQPGKIPVVFVHGLLSDPFTWSNAANELRARPQLNSRYQIWGFQYPTGEPFLKSAAVLRDHLNAITHKLDPEGADPALSQIVLIGHSMGGLVAKLQVTSSGDQLWNAISKTPLDCLVTTEETRAALENAFCFDPVPTVSRVVFLGTPHSGSPKANRPIGRLGTRLVDEPSSMNAIREQLIRDNPRAFSKEFERRIPTSIDLLRPQSPLLQEMNCLKFSDSVRLHSIIGCGYYLFGSGDSDKVVPVASARNPWVDSELLIISKHTKINSNEEALEELYRILQTHLVEQCLPEEGPIRISMEE
ncbi:MAG: alpha/beta fold hydrolase [Mariniblastus sp.]|nr:alpha/beta fold hydrolase [Mariniblastus sp.]